MAGTTKYSSTNLLPGLSLDPARWNRKISEPEIASTSKAVLNNGNIEVIRVKDGRQALDKIKNLIPSGSEVMNGASTTLAEIGFLDYLKSGEHNWVDLHTAVTSENDEQKRAELRRRSVIAEYFVSGVNAIAMTGELLACDTTGSRTGAWLFAAKNLILVSGVNKIVPTVDDALQRIREFVYPLEEARLQKASGGHSRMAKFAILANERKSGRVKLILIDEVLGY